MESERPAQLYVHIPFCPSKCPYCAFVTRVGSLKLLPPYLESLKAEFDLLASHSPGAALETVYLGGGTPSLMSPAQLSDLLTAAQDAFGLRNDAEISLEAHPETVDEAVLDGFRRAGANRLSFGVESMRERELAALGRSYNRYRVAQLVHMARRAGFSSLNLDLMYGVPEQTLDSWQDSLLRVLELRPEHLSLYPLSIEPASVFAWQDRRGLLRVPDDSRVVEMYRLARERLAEAGYQHYEIANWALPGRQCRHNLACWHGKQYYAAGTGAHGYLVPHRYENTRHMRRYFDAIEKRERPVAREETIDTATASEELIILRLRLLDEGLPAERLDGRFDRDVDELVSQGLLLRDNNVLRLAESAVPVANEVWERFVA
ncbi:MAG: radical SAM family heme chaperone HemW [Chloroflexota bacterium]